MEWWNDEMTEWWNDGMIEWWSDGMMEWSNDGMMEWWNNNYDDDNDDDDKKSIGWPYYSLTVSCNTRVRCGVMHISFEDKNLYGLEINLSNKKK